MSLRAGARAVHSCFRRVERCADKATGAAGPFFVLIAATLLPICFVTFFEVVFPHRFLQPDTWFLTTLFGLLWCLYIVYSITFHYIMAIAIPPGSPSDRQPVQHRFPPTGQLVRSFSRLFRVTPLPPRALDAQPDAKRSEDLALARLVTTAPRYCKRCPRDRHGRMPTKPERAHHCKISGTCVLKFDHYCPWINGPVGLHNERYFTLFMVYLAVGLGCVVVWAWKPMLRSVFDHRTPWPHYTPRACTLMLWILAVALGLAIVIMALWQLWSIGRGETSVEANDNDFYRSLAKARGHVYINPFDLGWRNNLRFFFGIGPNRPLYTIWLPRPYPPACDGWTWPKRAGWEANASFLAPEEELTDEEAE